MIRIALEFSGDDIEVLLHGQGLLWYKAGGKPTILSEANTILPADRFDFVAKAISGFLFGAEDLSSGETTFDQLAEIDTAKSLHLASAQPALIVGHDCERQCLLARPPALARTTIFEVRDEALEKVHIRYLI